jgi:hypothetical protein
MIFPALGPVEHVFYHVWMRARHLVERPLGLVGSQRCCIHASPWRVEARAGGNDGVSELYVGDSEATALELADQFIAATDDTWRELTVRPAADA